MVGLGRGTLIAGRYRLVDVLARGGMATVWRAQHLSLGAPVAIKFLDEALVASPEMAERFEREARSAAVVRHTHVAHIFDYGVDWGRPFIVMELLSGERLEARLARRGPMSPAELCALLEPIALAIGHAHEQGVVHRDLKPANIFITREGDRDLVKVLDFGIAKVFAGSERSTYVSTEAGTLLGTPAYMSPEQVRGRGVDYRSDLWALTVVAFECLTGRVPFEGRSPGDLLVEICSGEPLVASDIAGLPRAFDAWFARGLAKEPARRFDSAAELCESFRELAHRERRSARVSTIELHTPTPAVARAPGVAPAGSAGPRARLERRVVPMMLLSAAVLGATQLPRRDAPPARKVEGGPPHAGAAPRAPLPSQTGQAVQGLRPPPAPVLAPASPPIEGVPASSRAAVAPAPPAAEPALTGAPPPLEGAPAPRSTAELATRAPEPAPRRARRAPAAAAPPRAAAASSGGVRQRSKPAADAPPPEPEPEPTPPPVPDDPDPFEERL